jgi:hypothetical protein
MIVKEKHPMNANPFDFNDSIINALEHSLSPERMSTYVGATNGNKDLAMRLYTWNTAASAAFYAPL